MTGPMTPAMTPEGWGDDFTADDVEMLRGGGCCPTHDRACNALADRIAARALHGQPFGFTRADARALTKLAEWELNDRVADDGDGHTDVWASPEVVALQLVARDIADRIDALLQPVVRRHAIAALALHGQPFGFTRADLEWLDGCGLADDGYASLRERIADLLPPEGQ